MADIHSLKIENTPVTLRELALEKIREAIISGYFKAGDRLVERSLCDELGVSRTVVREVIRYLEAEGLIENIPKKGPIVAVLSWEIASQIYDIRQLLETEAAKDCAEIATATDKKQLYKQLMKIAKAGQARNETEQISASMSFYESIFSIANHTIAWEVVQRLNSRISRLRALTLACPARKKTGFEHMSRIYQAIEDNNPRQAKEAVKKHLTEAASLARSVLENGDK